MLYFETVEDRLLLSSVAALNHLDSADLPLIASPNLATTTVSFGSPVIVRNLNLSLSGFTLFNTTTGQSLGTLTEGETIDLATLPKKGLTIIASAAAGSVGSVVFGYDGNSQSSVDNVLPYSLIGSVNSHYSTWQPTLGEHTVSAIAYSGTGASGRAGTQISVDFNVINSAAISSFSLIDADNNQVLGPLVNGQSIDLGKLPTQNLTVVATTTPQVVGSVVFGYDGNASFHTENFWHYALDGKTSDGYHSWTPTVGQHTLTATPYSLAHGLGGAGTPLTINFTVTNSSPTVAAQAPAVTGFELFNLKTNTSIETLQEGQSIDLATLPTADVVIVANTDTTSGSVVFGVDSDTSFQSADTAPYALDTWAPAVGAHTVTATPYSGADGAGTAGTPLSIDLTIIDSTPIVPPATSITGLALVDADNGQTLGPLINGETIDLAGLPSQNLQIVATSSSSGVGSVVFDYDSNTIDQIQNNSPYVFGTWTPQVGAHTLTATTYSSPDGAGDVGGSMSVSFNIINSAQVTPPNATVAPVTAFGLLDDDNGQFLGSLSEGQTIDLGTLPTQNVSIVAMTGSTPPASVGSVVFGYDDNAAVQTIDAAPYALTSVPLALGAHTITATPFAGADGTGTSGSGLSVDFKVINSSAVTGLELIDTYYNQVVMPITNGTTIDLGALPSQDLAIAVITTNTDVLSVMFTYDGNSHAILGATPYVPSGPWMPSVGQHTLTATPYSGLKGAGLAGTPLTVNFTVVNSDAATNFTLINAATGQALQTLTEGSTVDLAQVGNQPLSIIAGTSTPNVGSVVFGYDSNSSYAVENSAPFALFSWSPALGSHTITATPYSAANGSGFAATPLSVDFTVINTTAVTGFTLVDADNGLSLGTLTEGETVDLSTLPTQNLEVVATSNSADVGSIVFGYDNNASDQTQDSSPYIFGAWTPGLGVHTLTATPYSAADATGDAGALRVDFTVIESTPISEETPTVTAFGLLNNDTGQIIGSLTNGETVDLGTLPTQNVSIVAITNNAIIGSVVFGYDGDATIQTDDAAPFVLSSVPLSYGPHTVSATPFSGPDGTGTAGTGLALNFGVIDSMAVIDISLVDTDNGQVLTPITEGSTIDLSTLPTQDLAIEATTTSAAVGSVLFSDNGNPNIPLQGTSTTESGLWVPTIGSHSITATPYSGVNGVGLEGISWTVDFNVVDSDAVTGFTLVNTNTGQAVETLSEGSTIDLGQLSGQNLAIVASTSPSPVGSLVFGYDSNSNFDVEDNAPYTLSSWSQAMGQHTITATPYSEADGAGFAGAPLTVDFTVVNSTAVTGLTLVDADNGQSLGALTSGETIDLSTLPTKDLTVIASTDPTSVGSVVFGYDSTADFQLDNAAPYSLTSGSWTPTVGPHTITATPYAAANAGGLAGASVSVNFNVIDSTTVTPPPNNDPNISVSITNPLNGESQAGPGYFVIRTSTADTAGTLNNVQFFVNGKLLGEADVQPYSMAWENASTGTYTLTAVASDSTGSTTSAPVNVTITTPVVARTLYVSPSGSNSNSGLSQGSALQTISAAAAIAKPGDTVLIEPGIYRETVTVPNSGTETQPITFQAATPGTVIIDGADPLGGWTAVAGSNPVYTTGWAYNFFHGSTRYYFGLSTDGTTTTVGYAEQFLYNNQPLLQVLSASSMTAGTFYIDYSAATVSVWLPGGATPTSSNMLASTRSHLFVPASTSVQYIRINGLTFQHAANFAQDEAVQTGTGWRVLNSTIQSVGAGALDVKGNDNLVYNVHALNNGDTGIDGTGSNNLFVFDETAGNNYKGFSVYNEAGGGKFAVSDGAYFDQYYAHDNVGPGLWFDYENTNYVVVNSYFYDNKPRVANYEGIGLQIEISQGPGRIENNTFYNNTGAALDICESMNVTAEHNFFYNSYLEFRDLPNRAPYHIQNIVVAYNDFDNSFIATSNGTWTTTSGTVKQIFINDDTFDDSGPLVYWNGIGYSTLASVYSTLGFEQNGSLGALKFSPAPSVV